MVIKSRNKREGFYHSHADGKHHRTRDIFYRLGSRMDYFDVSDEMMKIITKFKDCWCRNRHFDKNGIDDTIKHVYWHELSFDPKSLQNNLCKEVML